MQGNKAVWLSYALFFSCWIPVLVLVLVLLETAGSRQQKGTRGPQDSPGVQPFPLLEFLLIKQ